MDEADIDPEDYYDVMADVDAQANSLIESPEPQAYLSEVTLVDDALCNQEIIKPRSYAQIVDSSNIFYKKWQFAVKKKLNPLTENNTWTLVPMPRKRRVIGCLWIFKIKRNSMEKF
jgi:hypothetical protein